MPTKCFLVEPVGTALRFLHITCRACDSDRNIVVGEVHADETGEFPRPDWDAMPWPTVCFDCGHVHDDDDHRSIGTPRMFSDGSEIKPLPEFGPGAMWNADWMPPRHPDGRSLFVRLPGPNPQDWRIDSRASNCGRPDDDTHMCWCRHGEPPELTVDKNCDTCEAGGGSIWKLQGEGEEKGEWHGHLTSGWLVKLGETVP